MPPKLPIFKKAVTLIATLCVFLSYGQQVIVYSNDFSTSSGTSYTTANAPIGNSTSWNLITSGTDMGGRINNGYLGLTNDATGANNAAGWVLGYTLNAAATPFNTLLASNPGQVTWTFNMRQITTNPSGVSNNSYGNAFVLAGTSNTTATTGSGYAVVLGNSGGTDPLRLIRYTAGLRTSTNLISSNTSGVKDFGKHYISVKVTYSPSSNTWELFVRKDSSSSFFNPATGAIYSQGIAQNTPSATTALPLMGGYWNAGNKKSQTAFFDNIRVTVATPFLASISPTSKVAGSAAFTLTTTGSNFTNASVIKWNGTALTTTYVSSTQLSATVAATNIATAGTASITVGTGAATSNAQLFYIDAPNVPSISTSASALNNFLTTTGTASASQSFTSTGSSLQSGSINIAAPANFEVSASQTGPYTSSINVTGATTTTYVRVAASAPAGLYSNPLILMSSGATTRQIALTATVLNAEPSTTATGLTFTAINSIQSTINWSGGNGGNHLVVVRSDIAVSANPADGSSYLASTTFATGADAGVESYVVYAGSANTVTVTGLIPATTYYVSVYEYNGSGGTENYRSTAKTGNFTTLNAPLGLQVNTANTVYKIDFDTTLEGVNNGAYEGSGLASLPDVGELNANSFELNAPAVTQNVTFGVDVTDEDPAYGNGQSDGNETDGGFYAFQVSTGNYALGFQADATYPSFSSTLRFQNQTGAAITSVNIGYKIYVRNDAAGSDSFNFTYSGTNASNTAYTALSVVNQSTTAVADALPGWKMYYKVVTLTGLNIANSGYYFIRWSSDALSGSVYDEVALDDITIIANPSTVFAPVSGEAETAVIAGNATMNGALSVNSDLTFNGGKLYIAANTLTLNGSVTNTSPQGISGGASSNIIVSGNVNPTLSFDQANVGTTNLLNNFRINTTGTNTVTTNNNLAVNGALTVDASQTLALGTNTLTGTLSTITNDGTITSANTTTAPFASGKTWGGSGTLVLAAATAAQYLPTGTYNKVMVSTTGGANATGNIILTGNLDLPKANVSATKGSFDTGAFSITMGSNSYNTGIGDVSGTVTRNSSITNNIAYTFGHPRTTIIYPVGGTLPTSMSLKTTLGAAPAGKTDAILRNFDLTQTGGTGTKATISAHYLDSELNGNTENKLVDWVVILPSTVVEQGRTNYNVTDNFVELSNVNVAFFSSSPGTNLLTLANSQAPTVTWNGSESTSWTTAANWTPNATPSDATNVIIPDAETTPRDPMLNSSVTIGTLNIQSGGILNTPAGGVLTITKTTGAWINQGTYNASTGTVTFNGPSANGDATIAGNTTFNNLTIPVGTNFRPLTDNIMNISGTFTKDGSLFAGSVTNTIIYSGTNQTVITPNGAITAYDNLTISGTGAIIPASLNIAGNLTTNQTVNFAGTTINMLGLETNGQNIGGLVSPSFNNLVLNKPSGSGTLKLQNNITVNGTLTLSSGVLDIANYNLTLGANAVAGTFSVTSMIDADGTGRVIRPYTGVGSYTFPLGETTSNTTYSPITVNITSGTFNNANVSVNVTDATHPNNYATDDYLTRYWSVTQTGITNAVATVSASYVTGDAVGGESTLAAAQLNGTFNATTNPWVKYGTLGSTTLTATNATLTAGQTSYFTGVKSEAITLAVTGGGTFCQNTYVQLSSTVSGGVGNYTYSWSNSLGSGATSIPPTGTIGSTTYTLTVRDANGNVATGTAVVIITAAPEAGTLSANQSICANTTPADIVLTGYVGTIVRWERSASTAFPNPTFITSTNATLTGAEIGTNLTTTRYLRAVVQNGSCDIVYSNVVEVKINTTTWDGTAWNNGVPTATDAVIFNGNYTAAGNLAACTITVNNGANVVVPSGFNVTVNGSVTVNTGGNFTFNNNAALVQVTNAVNTGNIIMHKNSNPLFILDYTLWSSPVQNQNLLAFSPQTLANRFYEYKYGFNATTNDNREQYFTVDPATTNFVAGKGYLIRMPNAITANVTGTTNGGTTTPEQYTGATGNYYFDGTFTGTPHNGNITYDLNVQSNRYTAIGNPYPSPISISDFFTANSSVIDLSSGIYLWRKRNNTTSSSYAILTQAGYVANPTVGGGAEQAAFYQSGSYNNWLLSEAQGFFVKTLPSLSSASITFTNSMRRGVAGTTQGFFKQANNNNDNSRVWLNMNGDSGIASQTLIAYINEGTAGIDYGFDARSFKNENSLAFYSIAENTPLVIQAKSDFINSDVVPMGFFAPLAGTYTVSIDHFEGVFEQGQKVYLKDKMLGTIHDLTLNNYGFTTDAGTFEGRFDVVYTTQVLGVEQPTEDVTNLYIFSKGTTIGVNSNNALIKSVTVYDIRGRKLYNQNDINALQFNITNLVAQKEVLLVEVETEKGKINKLIVF